MARWQEGGCPTPVGLAAKYRMRTWLLIFIALQVTACSQLDRLTAVSAGDTSRATVLGIADGRFLPTDIKAISVLGQRLYEREAKYGAASYDTHTKEYFLALSGGGDNGAFAAGLLVGWSESGTRPAFKIVTGISTGALIAPFSYLGSTCDPIIAQMYSDIEQKDIFQRRPVLAGLTSDALADTGPLENMIARYLDADIVERIAEEYRRGRALIIVTTNLDAGVPVIWNIGAIAESGRPERVALIRKILLASAAVPALFPPVMFDVTVDGAAHQELHVDGGASMQTFLYPVALQIGRTFAAKAPRTRIAYVIRNGRLTPDWSQVERSTLSIASRAVATLTINQGVGDLFRMYALTKRDGIGFRLAFIDDGFREPHPAEFDHAYMTKLFEYARAKSRSGYPWLTAPPGF
jgi:predicted acylesterase/phospholipase RssA